MEEPSLNQSSWSRTRQETIHTLHSGKFWMATIVMEAILMIFAYMVTPDGSSGLTYTVIQAVAFTLGMLAMVGLAFVFSLIVVPYRQRNEARNRVEQQREPSDSEVNNTIRLLQTESLVTKHNNGEKQSYSFATVFLAIADQLSIGISLIQFESKIKKGLDIDEGGDWYFPYEDEGITHLIGVLDQSALIERLSTPYQNIESDYSKALSLANAPTYLAKGTETKYYLLPFGVTVAQQLRKQPTVYNEIAKIVQELRTFNVIGDKELDVATILYEMREKLAVGLYEMEVAIELRPVFAELRIRRILDLVKRERYSGLTPHEAMCWELDSLGKEVIQYLERVKQPASHKEGSPTE